MTVLAIPADLEVARPPCERYDAATTTYTSDTVPAQARTQLASALDLGGPRCATRAVQQLTGLAITRYVGLDLARLGDAVNALSGVRFCTPRAVVDSALGPVVPTPGTVSLDAGKATDFARASAVEGDPAAGRGRIERQQQVLAAVLGPALSDTGLLDLRRVAALRPALGHALTTDAADLDQVLALANGMRDLGATGVTFTAVPTDPDPADQGSVLRAGEAATLFDALRTDAPLPATATGAAAGPRPSDLTVQVANASDRPGVAGKVADTLRGLGFRIGDVTNAAQPTPQTLIRYSPDQTAAAQLLATTVPAATTVPDPGRHRRAAARARPVVRRRRPGADHHAVRISRTSARGPARHRELRLTVVGRSPPLQLQIRLDRDGRLPSVHARRLSGPTRRAGLEPGGHVRGGRGSAGQGDPGAAGERSAPGRRSHHRGRPRRRAARPAEEQAFALLALQAPVATDLRIVVSAIHGAGDIERMGDLALHVAQAARRRHPQPLLPAEVAPYFAEMGRVGCALARKAGEVIRSRDLAKAAELESDDDAMDDLHQHMFSVLMDRNWSHGVEPAVDITLLARFYERYADHAVAVARRIVYVVTGRMPGPLTV